MGSSSSLAELLLTLMSSVLLDLVRWCVEVEGLVVVSVWVGVDVLVTLSTGVKALVVVW
jgi:hypothetical protein